MLSIRRRRHNRTYILVPLCLVILGIAAIVFSGGGARAAPADDPLGVSLKQFTQIYDAVEQNFADSVKADKSVYNGAIPGMLHTLDPHSNFFDPKAYAAMRDDQRGQYYGVGMQVGPRNGKTIVIAPFGGSPAYRAGLRPGDTILEVDDKRTDNLTTTEVADRLKGPHGTPVQILGSLGGGDKPVTLNLIR